MSAIQVYSRRNSNPFLLERPNGEQAKPTFKTFHIYYDELLKHFPITEKIKNQNTKRNFEVFKAKIEELDCYSIKCEKKVNDAENYARRMKMHSNSIINIFPAIEEKKQDDNDQSGYQPILDLQELKENSVLKSSLKTVIETSNLILKTGNSLATGLDYEEKLTDLVQQTTKIYDAFKIDSKIEGYKCKDEIREKLNELESKLQEIEQSIKIHEKNFSENQAQVRNNQSSFDITKSQLDLKKLERDQLESIIKTILSDIDNIRKLKANANQTFEKKKEEVKKKYEDKLENELVKKQNLLNKIDDKQSKVLSELDDNLKVVNQIVNYILIIDRSGSMSSHIAKVNKAAEDFLLNLKKTNNKNFKFTVIYFDDEGYLTADTLPLANYNSFSQFLNMNASGGTDYSQAFNKVYEVVSRNWTDKIDRVNMIFFTDGGDGGNRDDSYNLTKNIKVLFSSKIVMYIRGLGNFSGTPLSHLQQLANNINSGSNSNLQNSNIKLIDTLSDIKLVCDFFLSISESYFDYYAEIEKKIQALEKIKDKLREDGEKLAANNLFALDEELNRIENLKNRDLKNAGEREETIKDLEATLKSIKIQKEEIDNIISELSVKLNMHQSDLDLSKKQDNSKLLDELLLQRKTYQRSIANEKVNVIKTETDNNRLLLGKWEEKREELGFSTVDDLLEFKRLVENFKESFLELQKTSNNYGTRISNFAEKLNISGTRIEDRINKNRDNEINHILDKISGTSNNLDALGESISNWVTFDEKNFSKKELLEFCRNRQLILKIMRTEEKKRNDKVDEECENLDCLKDITQEIADLENEIFVEYDDENDVILKNLEKEYDEIEKIVNKFPDVGDKDELKTKKKEKEEKREQMTKRRTEIVLEKAKFQNEKKVKQNLKIQKLAEKSKMSGRMKKVMKAVISLIEKQDRCYNNLINSMNINKSIQNYKEEIKCIEEGME